VDVRSLFVLLLLLLLLLLFSSTIELKIGTELLCESADVGWFSMKSLMRAAYGPETAYLRNRNNP
jgi:hypothetical protein